MMVSLRLSALSRLRKCAAGLGDRWMVVIMQGSDEATRLVHELFLALLGPTRPGYYTLRRCLSKHLEVPPAHLVGDAG
jgi:hypothetical protein